MVRPHWGAGHSTTTTLDFYQCASAQNDPAEVSGCLVGKAARVKGDSVHGPAHREKASSRDVGRTTVSLIMNTRCDK